MNAPKDVTFCNVGSELSYDTSVAWCIWKPRPRQLDFRSGVVVHAELTSNASAGSPLAARSPCNTRVSEKADLLGYKGSCTYHVFEMWWGVPYHDLSAGS